MKFLHPKHTTTAMAFFMSLIMSGAIALAFSLMHGGFSLTTLAGWPTEWLQGWIVALPIAIVVMPQVRKIVVAITAVPSDK